MSRNHRKARGRAKKTFWEREYRVAEHLAMSETPSSDLVKFTRWLERREGRRSLNPLAHVLDLGCGNGRNTIFLHQEYGARGLGYDTASSAIAIARTRAATTGLRFEVQSIAPPLSLPDGSSTFILDMMSSHVLSAPERTALRAEEARVLRTGGWLFLKTFLRDGDLNAARMLREAPTDEQGTYLHPEFNVREHVYSEAEIREELEPYFIVHRVTKSHGHIKNGRAHKRRSMCVYAQKRA